MKKDKFNYRIFRIEKQIDHHFVHNKKITMKKFNASSDEEALEYLKQYKAVANKEYVYYYESWSPTVVIDDDGKKHYYEDCFEAMRLRNKDKSFMQRVKDFFIVDCHYWFIDNPRRFFYWIKDKIYLLRTKHNRAEAWSLDYHILDDILWNIPIINKNCHGIAFPYLDMALKETHKEDKNFNLEEWNKTHHEYTKEEENLALKYQEESRNELVKYVKLYTYYRDHGSTDDSEFDKKWHHTLPIKTGTFDSFDYAKLEALQRKYWNKIWEWIRVYGESLWD